MRLLAAIVLVVASSGCAFDHGEATAGDGTGVGTDPTVDAGASDPGGPGPIARTCRYPDPALRLCLEFDDGALTPLVHDGSTGHLDAAASGLQPTMRNNDPAVKIETGATISVPETSALDLPKITIEAWVNPDTLGAQSIVRNEGQYVLMLDGTNRVGCSMAGTTVFTDSHAPRAAPGSWSHVACTFDGHKVAAFLDGSSIDCSDGDVIATNGTQGTVIAPNFKGGIDGVRIYAADLGSKMCGHAGSSNCIRICN